MKIFFTICISFISIISFGQTKTVVFQGQQYTVYPARLPYYISYNSYRDMYTVAGSRQTTDMSKKYFKNRVSDLASNLTHKSIKSMEMKMEYNPLPLPDGNYLIYFQKIPYDFDKYGLPVYRAEDTTRVAMTFQLKDGKIHGKSTGYDFFDFGLAVQHSEFVDGVKSGKWTIEFGDAKATYSYQKNVKHGPYLVTRDGITRKEGMYINGELTESKRYNSKGVMTWEYRQNGFEAVRKQYFGKTGKLESYSRSYNGIDLEEQEFYANGQLQKQESYDPQNLQTNIISYYKNGQLKSEITEQWEAWGDYAPNPLLPFQHMLARKLDQLASFKSYGYGEGKKIAAKYYHKNGQLKAAYDVRKITPGTLQMMHSNGKIESQFVLRGDSSFQISDYYKKSTDITDYVWYNGSSWVTKRKELNKDGEVVEWSISPYPTFELENTYEEQIGFIKIKEEVDKKYIASKYYLLHNGATYFEIIPTKKEDVNHSFVSEISMSGADTTLEITKSQFTKDGLFRIDHKKKIPYGKVSSGDLADWEKSQVGDVQDTSLMYFYYKDILFSGTVQLENKRHHKIYKNKAKVKELKSWGLKRLEVKGLQDFKKSAYTSNVNYYVDFLSSIYYPSHYNYRNYSDLTSWKTVDLDHFDIESGRLHGVQSEGTYSSTDIRYEHGLMDGPATNSYGGQYGFYNSGMKHGRFEDGNYITHFNANRKDGEYLKKGLFIEDYDAHNQVSARAHFDNDTLNGEAFKFSYPHKAYESMTYNNGLLDGKYTGGTSLYPNLKDFTFKDGFIVDTAKVYFREGTLKAKAVYNYEGKVMPFTRYQMRNQNYRGILDTIHKRSHAELQDVMFRYSNGTDRYSNGIALSSSSDHDVHIGGPEFNGMSTGTYEYFYKNGMKSMEGEVINAVRVGTWNFYDLNGGLLKVVKYDTGMYITPNSGDTIIYYGIIDMYYPNGKKLLNGYVTDETSRYKCDQEQQISMEDIYYLEFYDREGNQTLTENGGVVYEYHNNNMLRLEGYYEDGKREGLWKFYDPDGRLEEIGSYEKGKKYGTWYEGDLAGIPYFDNACAVGVIEDYPAAVDTNNPVVDKKLTINITHYTVFGDGYRNSTETTMKLLPFY